LDPEVLAALLDGRLSGKEREEVLTRLARSPEDFDAFAEAAATVRDVADVTPLTILKPEPEPEPKPKPSPGPNPQWWSAKIWLPIAAVLVGAILLRPSMRSGGESTIALLAGPTLVARPGDSSLASALGADWEQPGWSVSRGGESALVVRQREFRVGVRLADVEASFDARDAAALRTAGGELVAGLGQFEGAGSIATEYQGLVARASAPDSLVAMAGDRTQARKDILDFLKDSPWFGLGTWVEQARLATLANKAAFFDLRASESLQRLIDRLSGEARADSSTVASLRRLQEISRDGVSGAEMSEVRSALADVIREAGG
jgi:hypothetical protein